MREFLGFYRACLARAFKGRVATAFGWTGSFTVLVSLGILTFSPSQSIERFLTIDLPGVFFVFALATTVVRGLVLAPFQIHQEEVRARAKLEARLRPKLEISLPKGGVVGINISGNTLETVGGRRQTHIRSFVEAVFLECSNIGEVRVRTVQSRVVAVTRQSPGASNVNMVESIELPWKKEDTSGSLTTDIPPGEKRRIWLGFVRSHGHFWVFREPKELPIDYQQVFGPPGVYRVLIQVDSDDTAPVQVLLEIETGEGPKPEHGVWHGMAKVALLEQASPRIATAMSV